MLQIFCAQIMSLLICRFRLSSFVLETLKLKWKCSQYLQLNPTYAMAGDVEETAKANMVLQEQA